MKGERIDIAFASNTYRDLMHTIKEDASKTVIIPLDNGMKSETEILSTEREGKYLKFTDHCSMRGKITGQCSHEDGWIEPMDAASSN